MKKVEKKIIEISKDDSAKERQMAQYMQKFLEEKKGIPGKVVNENEGLKTKDDDGKEVDAIPAYKVVGTVAGVKGARPYNWEIRFDRDDIDDKGKPHRHLILDAMDGTSLAVDFDVNENKHLSWVFALYDMSWKSTKSKRTTKKTSAKKKAPSKPDQPKAEKKEAEKKTEQPVEA